MTTQSGKDTALAHGAQAIQYDLLMAHVTVSVNTLLSVFGIKGQCLSLGRRTLSHERDTFEDQETAQ